MLDFATLGLRVVTTDLLRGRRELGLFSREAEVTERRVANLGRTASMAFASMAGGAGIFLAAFAGGAMVNTIANFERSMSKLAGISGATKKELVELRDVAKSLGSSTEFTASQAVDGLTFLAQAGFSAKEALEAIPATLDLATAASMDLATAADIASNIMSAFGIEAKNMGGVSDVLAAAAAKANTNVQQLGTAMRSAGSVAKGVGYEMYETAAAIGILSNAGRQGEMAGTDVRNVIASLVAPSGAAEDAIKALGFTLSDLSPETNSFAEIVDKLAKKGIDAASAMTIFGRETGPAILALVGQNEQLQELTLELSNVEGAAAAMAATLRDNLGGDIDSLFSSIEGLVLAFGDAGLTGGLRTATQALTTMFRFLTSELERLLTYAGVFAAFFAGRYVLSMGQALYATYGLVGGLKALKGAIVRTGIGALIVLAGELVYQFMGLIDKTGSLGNALSLTGTIGWEVMQRIGDAGRGLYHVLLGAAQGIGAAFVNAFSYIAKQWDLVINGMALPFNAIMRGLKLDVSIATSDISGSLGKLADQWETTAVASIEKGGQLIRDAATTPLDALFELNSVVAETGDIVTSTLPPVDQLGTSLDDIVPPALGAAGALGGGGGGGGVAGAAGKVSEAAKEAKEKLDELKQSAESWKDRVAKPIETYAKSLAELDEVAKAGLLDGTDTYARAVRQLNIELADSIPAIGGVADAFGDWVSRGLKDFDGFVDSVIGSFQQMLATMISEAAKNRIIISLGMGQGGPAGAAGGGGMMGGIGSMLGGVGASFMAGAGNTLAALTGTGAFAGMGGLGTAASYVSTSLGMATSSLGGFAAAAGAIALPLAAVAGAVMFFRTKTKELDRGLRLTAEGADLAVETFSKIEKSRFFGLSKSKSTSYDAAGSEISDPLTQAYDDMVSTSTALASAIGLGRDALKGFTHEITLSTKGMSDEEAMRALQDELAGLGESLADALIGSTGLVRKGEAAADALQRVVTELVGVNEISLALGHNLMTASVSGARAASAMVEAAGGLDALRGGATAYLEAFYSEQERTALETKNLTAQMEALGLRMPQSRAEFRALVESIDTSTVYGAKLYGTLISLAGAMDDVLPKLDEMSDRLKSMVEGVSEQIDAVIRQRSDLLQASQRAASEWVRAAETLRGFVSNMRGTVSSTNSAQDATAYNQSQFNQLYKRGRNGDQGALGDITGVAQSLLNSKALSARSSVEETRTAKEIAGKLGSLANVAESEADRQTRIASILEKQLALLGQLKDAVTTDGLIDPKLVASITRKLGGLELQLGRTGVDLDKSISHPMTLLRGSINDLRQAVVLEAKQKASSAAAQSRAIAAQLQKQKTIGAAQNVLSNKSLAQKGIVNKVEAGIQHIWDLAEKYNVKLKAADGSAAKFGVDKNGIFQQDYASIHGSSKNIAAYKAAYYAQGSAFDQTYGLADDLKRAKSSLDAARAQVRKLGAVPAFRAGGDHKGGFRLVGEGGPEIEATGKSRIFNARQTREILSGQGGNSSELAAIRTEIRMLREQQLGIGNNLVTDTRRIRQIEETRETIGMPVERTTT